MKDAYYFSHDSNAKDDPKCVMLIETLQLEGYGIFWMLVETLRDQPDYKYPIVLIPALARRYNTTPDKIKAVVKNYGLFEIENNEFFYSESLIRRMKLRDDIVKKRIKAGKASGKKRKQLSLEHKLNTCSTHAEQLKERKGKEIKGKEKKDYTQTDSIIDYFNEITGQNRRYSNSSREPIHARLAEFTIEDCKTVIDIKFKEWKGDPDNEKYITIETFFRPSKFEKYLNQKTSKVSSGLDEVYERLKARGEA